MEGPKANVFHHFNFRDADDLFSKFFNNHEFDDDPFFSSAFGNRDGKSNKGNGIFGSFGGFGGFGSSMFDNDPFFNKNGAGSGLGGFSSNGGGVRTGVSKSVSTTTKSMY